MESAPPLLPEPARPGPMEWAGLGFALLVALAFRAHVDNSPFPFHTFERTDEVHYVSRSVGFLNGEWDVTYFKNPSLYMYVLYAGSLVAGIGLVVTGRYDSLADFVRAASADPYAVTIAGRVISILAGVAGVAVLWLVARRLYSHLVAFVGALALAVDRTHASRCMLAGNEALMTLLVLLFLLVLLRHVRRPTAGSHAVCGLLLGLAVSTKYNAAVHVVTLLAATLVVAAAARDSPVRRELQRTRAWVGFLCVPLGFVTGSPCAAVNFGSFLAGFSRQASLLHEFWSEENAAQTSAFQTYVLGFPEANCGLVFALLCLAGIVAALVRASSRRDVRSILMVSAVVPVFLYLGRGSFHLMRFLLPAIPFVLLLGAWAYVSLVSWSVERLDTRNAGSVRPAVCVLGALAVLGPGAAPTYRALWREFGRPDARAELLHWMRDNLDPEKRYLKFVYPAQSNLLDQPRASRAPGRPLRATSLASLLSASATFEGLLAELGSGRWDGLVVSIPGRIRDPRQHPEDLAQRLRAFDRKRFRALARCEYWDRACEHLARLECMGFGRGGGAWVAVLKLP